MNNQSVAEFARELGRNPKVLLEQLRAAGVKKDGPDALLCEADKYALLLYLQSVHASLQKDPAERTSLKESSKLLGDSPDSADLKKQQNLALDAIRALARRCFEVTIRGKKSTFLVGQNGEYSKLDESCDIDGASRRRHRLNKVILVGTGISSYFDLATYEISSLAPAQLKLPKLIVSYLRSMATHTLPNSQYGLRSRSTRTRQAMLLGVENDLIRFEYVLTGCAATISLN